MTIRPALVACSAILLACSAPVIAKTTAGKAAPQGGTTTAPQAAAKKKPPTPKCTSPFKWCPSRSGSGGICMIGKCPTTSQSVQ